jgi:hypothetical protein
MRTLLATVAAASFTFACAEQMPERLALDPSGPFKMDKKGEKETTKVAAFMKNKRPYVKAVPADWQSNDTSVATIENGVITATGSGKTTVTATAWGLTTSADVEVVIVGSVEVVNDVPKPFKLKAKPHPLKVTVKDDKGNVIAKPLVRYKASNYCVEVSDDGVLSPLADGDCDVIIESADKSTKIKIETRE